MNKKYKYLFKNLGILTISNFASKILVFLLVPLYTSVLSTDEYGTYDLVISTVSLMYPLLTLNIVDAVMRFSMDKSCSIESIVSIGIKYISSSFIVVAVFLFIINRIGILQEIAGFEIFIFLYYLFYVLNQFFIQFAKGLEKITDMGVAGVLGTVIMIASNVLFLIVFRLGLPGFFIANILSQAIPVAYFFVRLRFWKYFKTFNIDKDLRKEMLLYCTPLIATVVGWWVNSTSDKYVVTFMCGKAANGVLAISYKIPQILNTFQAIFIQAWQISAIKEYGENDSAKFYGSSFAVVNVLMCAACSWLIILSKPLAGILYAKDFYVAWQYVPFLLISSVLNCASGFLGPILAARKDSKSMALSAVYGATVNVILNILLVYLIGIQGATIATVISSFVIYQVRKKAVRGKIVIDRYRTVLITWGLLCIQALVEIYTSYWYVEVALMLIMVFLNRSRLKEILTMGKGFLKPGLKNS